MRATTSLFIDKSYVKASGKCAIYLRVTYDRKRKYYPTNIDLSLTDFEKVKSGNPRSTLKNTKMLLGNLEKKAHDIIAGLPLFTWEMFERQYLQNRGARNTVSLAFDQYASDLRESGSIGTAVVYECAQRSLDSFKEGLTFADITPGILKQYDDYMKKKGNSDTTISIYLRALRTLFNNAIADGTLSRELYPFGKKRYEIPTARNVKKALTLEEIAKIYYHEVPGNGLQAMAKDFWLFMYLCNGINVKDLCLLKQSDIQGDTIVYVRAKTQKTKREVEPITIYLNDDTKAIIKRWGVKNLDPNQYIFPILKKSMTAERQRQIIQQLTKNINRHMRLIASELGIENDPTTYAARHSFATVLYHADVAPATIKDLFKHSSLKVTENYMATLPSATKKEAVKLLTAFKKVN